VPVRLLLVAALTALAVGVVAWPGRSGRARLTWAVLFALVLLPNAWMESRWLATQSAAGRVVAALSGRAGAGAYCQRLSATFFYAGAEQGHVQYLEDGTNDETAWLTYETCQRIRDWRASDKDDPSEEQVRAVHILSHESAHVAGERSEAVAECSAVQWDARTARLLGATPQQARALQLDYWTGTYPHLYDSYRSGECREDGPLDLSPHDGVWP
jgi:hypothetical protein